MNEIPNKPIGLNYRSPQRSGVNLMVPAAVACAVVAATIAAICFYLTVVWAVGIFHDWRRWHYVDPHDETAGVVLLLIGCVCILAAYRWLAWAISGARRAGNK